LKRIQYALYAIEELRHLNPDGLTSLNTNSGKLAYPNTKGGEFDVLLRKLEAEGIATFHESSGNSAMGWGTNRLQINDINWARFDEYRASIDEQLDTSNRIDPPLPVHEQNQEAVKSQEIPQGRTRHLFANPLFWAVVSAIIALVSIPWWPSWYAALVDVLESREFKTQEFATTTSFKEAQASSNDVYNTVRITYRSPQLVDGDECSDVCTGIYKLIDSSDPSFLSLDYSDRPYCTHTEVVGYNYDSAGSGTRRVTNSILEDSHLCGITKISKARVLSITEEMSSTTRRAAGVEWLEQ
jgi:hypothetical protein